MEAKVFLGMLILLQKTDDKVVEIPYVLAFC